MIGLPACPKCFMPLRMSLDEAHVPWMECGCCRAVYSHPVEVLAYIEPERDPGYDD